jgi:4-diphosphocytidyl-2-C-methyl-D-erythritol kinase
MKIRQIGRDGRSIEIASPAKVNLFFELQGKRDDGFHEIETVMSTVSLFDDLEFVASNDGEIQLEIELEGCTAQESIPCDHRNLIVNAMNEVREECGKPHLGCNIRLRKRIPSAAGLGGASGNAAAALLAANLIWKLELSQEKLCQLAGRLGSDIPFFLAGGTARCTGRGEIIESVDVPAGMSLVIAKPHVGLSTAEVYGLCKVPPSPRDAASLLQALQQGNWNSVGTHLFNRLEEFASSMTPAIGELKEIFDRLDCVGHQMSGSGSSYFGIFRNAADAQRAAKIATRTDSNTVFTCETLGRKTNFQNPVVAG